LGVTYVTGRAYRLTGFPVVKVDFTCNVAGSRPSSATHNRAAFRATGAEARFLLPVAVVGQCLSRHSVILLEGIEN
jgi:hypothetical protein